MGEPWKHFSKYLETLSSPLSLLMPRLKRNPRTYGLSGPWLVLVFFLFQAGFENSISFFLMDFLTIILNFPPLCKPTGAERAPPALGAALGEHL